MTRGRAKYPPGSGSTAKRIVGVGDKETSSHSTKHYCWLFTQLCVQANNPPRIRRKLSRNAACEL